MHRSSCLPSSLYREWGIEGRAVSTLHEEKVRSVELSLAKNCNFGSLLDQGTESGADADERSRAAPTPGLSRAGPLSYSRVHLSLAFLVYLPLQSAFNQLTWTWLILGLPAWLGSIGLLTLLSFPFPRKKISFTKEKTDLVTGDSGTKKYPTSLLGLIACSICLPVPGTLP
ncbi:hypothetical protein SLEP1_g58839 [Rubroshorea leprosula]|uniref:Uncharacterized protein n=1 Tax=Rubroshorea leprosula TaxID=152421 RepID=A0AAV5MPS5_9ROSI|nr:hypothetical protein SLEP1_g58594 [Rubroshorea leprosula]GKV52250.1 hypothetical protein SLEP1_g58839 [Rubroshorea leprosula]